jgi:hypothetical protein
MEVLAKINIVIDNSPICLHSIFFSFFSQRFVPLSEALSLLGSTKSLHSSVQKFAVTIGQCHNATNTQYEAVLCSLTTCMQKYI